MLDPTHYEGLRLALESLRTTSVASLVVEGNEQSLYSRRVLGIILQYAIILAASPLNPANEVSVTPKYADIYGNKPKSIKPFSNKILRFFYTKHSSLVFETTCNTF